MRKGKAPQCKGWSSKNKRCERPTLAPDGWCKQCRGAPQRRAEMGGSEGEGLFSSGRDGDRTLDSGTVGLLGSNLAALWERICASKNTDVGGALREIYPKMGNVRSLVGSPFVGFNLLLLACRATEKGWQSSEWAPPGQWRKRGRKVRHKAEVTHVLVHSQADDQMFPRAVGLYNGDQTKRRLFARMRGKGKFDANSGSAEKGPPKSLDEMAAAASNMGIAVTTDPSKAPVGKGLLPGDGKVILLDDPKLARSENERTLQFLHKLQHEGYRQLRHSGAIKWKMLEMEQELCAVIGTMFCAKKLGIPLEGDPGRGHARYIEGSRKEIQSDPDLLMRASSVAGEVADYISNHGVLD